MEERIREFVENRMTDKERFIKHCIKFAESLDEPPATDVYNYGFDEQMLNSGCKSHACKLL